MKQYNICLEESTIKQLFLEGVDGVLRELIEIVLNQLLEARAEEKCNAKPYEQTDERTDYRNGYRERSFIARIGKLVIAVPRLRSQSVADDLFGSYKRSEQAIIATVAEMVVKGVSTRDVKDVALALFGEEISKSQVSRMCAVLDPVVAEFRTRKLDEYYPFIIVDAIYLDVRDDNRVLSHALYVAIGVNTKGHREVLGFMLDKGETKSGYREFFQGLKKRGLKRIDLAVSDAHDGLKQALKEEFVGASWQRCQTHFSRNMLDQTPKSMWADVKTLLHDIYYAPDIDKARDRMRYAVSVLAKKAPKAAALLEEAFDDITAVFSLPGKYRVKLRTSNGIERLNEEIRRRDRALRIYPSEGSVYRIIGTLLLEQHGSWQTGRVYLDMDEYFASKDSTVTATKKTNKSKSEEKEVAAA